MHISSLIHKLYELGAIKFGKFTLKGGMATPFYIDLRLVVSQPKFLVTLAEAAFNKIRDHKTDLICGVPYAALPFATAISIQHNIPMLLCRKESKEYGTRKQIEGVFCPDQTCLLVEDVIVSGQSIYETIVHLQREGLLVTDILVLVDREQGGKKFLESKGFRVHSVCTITDILQELLKEKKISKETVDSSLHFLRNAQTC